MPQTARGLFEAGRVEPRAVGPDREEARRTARKAARKRLRQPAAEVAARLDAITGTFPEPAASFNPQWYST